MAGSGRCPPTGSPPPIRPLPETVLKRFTGRDVVSRWDVLSVYSRAASQCVSLYLDELERRCPLPVLAIQVDGGSEFKAVFEEECRRRGILLFELPSRSPKPACRPAGPRRGIPRDGRCLVVAERTETQPLRWERV